MSAAAFMSLAREWNEAYGASRAVERKAQDVLDKEARAFYRRRAESHQRAYRKLTPRLGVIATLTDMGLI